MVADPTARTVGKISGGSKKYRKGVDHRKEGRALKRGGGAEWCKAMHNWCPLIYFACTDIP